VSFDVEGFATGLLGASKRQVAGHMLVHSVGRACALVISTLVRFLQLEKQDYAKPFSWMSRKHTR